MTAEVAEPTWGPNVTSWSAVAKPSGTGTNKQRMVNGIRENWYYQGGADIEFRDTVGPPSTVTVELPEARRIDTAVIDCPTPWQASGSLLDATVEALVDGAWVEVGSITETPVTLAALAPNAQGRCLVDTYYSGRSLFIITFASVVATAVRIAVTDCTYGGNADAVAAAAGGQGGSQVATIREIGVYSRQSQVQRLLV